MKLFKNKPKAIYYFLLILIVGCKDRDILSINELYPFSKIAKIEIKPSSTDYELFVSNPVKLDLVATDISGERLSIPDSLVDLFVNGQLTEDKQLSFQDAGQYEVKVQFGKIESSPVVILAKDEVASLEVSYSRDVFYLNEETEPIDISVNIKNKAGQTQSIKDKSLLKVSVNGQDLTGNTFLPQTTGTFKVQASLKNHKSPVSDLTSLDAFQVVNSIVLTAHSKGGTNLGIAGRDEQFELKAKVYNKDNKELPFSKHLNFYSNGTPLNSNSFAIREAGDYQIQAQGYGVTSEKTLIKMRQDNVMDIVKIPIIFHFIDITPPTDAQIAEIINQVNLNYRGENKLGITQDPNVVNTYIQFELAKNDPNGKPLNRAGLNIVSHGSDLTDNLTTQSVPENPCYLNFWNPNEYINVWVVNVPNVGWSGKGSLPLSQKNFPPGYVPPRISPFLMGTWMNKSLSIGTLIHEFGHNLGLSHTFSGDPVNNSFLTTAEACKLDVDGCEDTPNYHRTSTVSDIYRESCSGSPFISTNFMDYSPGLNNSFTFDQRALMRWNLENAFWLPTNRNRNLRMSSHIDKIVGQAVKPTITICY